MSRQTKLRISKFRRLESQFGGFSAKGSILKVSVAKTWPTSVFGLLAAKASILSNSVATGSISEVSVASGVFVEVLAAKDFISKVSVARGLGSQGIYFRGSGGQGPRFSLAPSFLFEMLAVHVSLELLVEISI